ncbi:MAG TPA: sigma-70 family RNA polymerase sigma factor [Solirubrobacteraceae bacterium]|nr:sigma-70 family RNA polymerase sigma factor [Solirubrobacteraceae bacterium]
MEASALKPAAAAGLRGPTPLLRLQSDERLIALVRRGNHAAFEALVARYQARLLAFCRHMLASREDAEDVLQEVFAASFNAILADDRPINVRPWLYRIARNRSLNHLRRHTAIGVDSMDVHLSEGGLTTADKVHRREEFRLLIGDVQELPETQRTALLLREIDALSYEQIAEAMETTVPSVKSLLVRARVSLAEMSEARQLTCEEVREELGQVAEGLTRVSAPVRRHLRSCEKCANFRKQLRETNKALASIMPVGPLLFLKKAFLAHLGTTASAGGAATAAAGAGGAGVLSAGASAVATKAAAGIAAAAIVTAGAVEVKRARVPEPHPPAAAAVAPPALAAATPVPAPVVAAPRTSDVAPSQPAHVEARRDEPARKPKREAEERPTDVPASATPILVEEPPGTVPAAATGPVQQGVDTTALPAQPADDGGWHPAPSQGTTQPQPQPEPQPAEQPPAEQPPAEEPAPAPAEPHAGDAQYGGG